MKLKNVLIVVKDIEKSRQFYHELFGLELVLDNNGNMILTEGLVLQEEKYWREFLGRDIIPENNAGDCILKRMTSKPSWRSWNGFIRTSSREPPDDP